jgi:Ca2+/Na+ antiporter
MALENHHYLVGSSCLFGIPIVSFLCKPDKNMMESLLSCLLIVNLTCSALFWYCPDIGSTMHYLDGYFGRLSLLLFTVYMLFLKEIVWWILMAFFLCLAFSLFLFSYSSHYSSESWCSDHHIFCHIWFHLFISAGCLLAFS